VQNYLTLFVLFLRMFYESVEWSKIQQITYFRA